MDYVSLNDYELVYQVKENNEIAYGTIFDKYKPLVKKIASDYYSQLKIIGIDYDDLCQEGFVAISKAIKEYDGDRALFYTYVYICIKREIEKYIKTYKRLKHKCLNEAISLNTPFFEDDKDELCLQDLIASNNNVEDYILSKELCYNLYYHKYDYDFETSNIYELKINKFNNMEISNLLDIPYRKVLKKVKEIKNDLSEYLKSIN